MVLALSAATLLFACGGQQPVDPLDGPIDPGAPSDTTIAPVDARITNCEKAIAVAEPVLFKTYGKENILGERPYHCEKVGGEWRLSGSLPEGYDGGVFSISLSELDGHVIHMIHTQ